jgi:hypothetical protein
MIRHADFIACGHLDARVLAHKCVKSYISEASQDPTLAGN